MANAEHLKRIRGEFVHWNEWRKDNPSVSIDLSNADLRGLDLSKSDLTGVNLKQADLRSTNLQEANLQGSDLSHARCGLTFDRTIILLTLLSGLALISMIFSFFVGAAILGAIVANFFSITAIAIYVTFVLYYWLVFSEGLRKGSVLMLLLAFFSMLVTIIVALSFKGLSFESFAAAAVTGVIFGVVVCLSAVSFTGSVAVAGAIATAGTRAGAIVIVVATLLSATLASVFIGGGGGLFSVVTSLVLTLFSAIMGRKAITGDRNNAWIRHIAVNFISRFGTRFDEASIGDANFTHTLLRNANLTNSSMIRTNWYSVRCLLLANVSETYLENEIIRKLVIERKNSIQDLSKELTDKNLRGLNLEGITLKGADLSRIDLRDCDLSKANLRKAMLIGSQLDNANLEGADLTGCRIQGWHVSASTNLENVICKYVFMSMEKNDGHKSDDPMEENSDPSDRMPPRGEFEPGAFTNYIKAITGTIELYHEREIDYQMALSILYDISRDYNETIEVTTVSKTQNHAIIRVKPPKKVSKEDFRSKYYKYYENRKQISASQNNQSYLSSQNYECVGEIFENMNNEISTPARGAFVLYIINNGTIENVIGAVTDNASLQINKT